MKKFWISAVLLIATLNLLDAFLTTYAISKGVEEANPLIRFALDSGFFLQIKILASVMICLCCLKIEYLPVKVAIAINLVAYFIITVYHVAYLLLIL